MPRPELRQRELHLRARQPPDLPTLGLLAGIALVVLLAIEMFADVAVVALNHGWVILAFGIAIEAVARALGTIAAGRSGRRAWAWACALLGTPAVAMFALFQKDGPISTDPAPLAGLMALLAAALIAIGILLAVL
jgi:hypothetical protein